MAKFKVWRTATLVVVLCCISASCSTVERPAVGGETGARESGSPTADPSPECLNWSPPCALPSASPTEDVWPPASSLAYKPASVRLPGKGWLSVPSAEDGDTQVMPNGALSDLAKSAAIVYDEDERYRLSKVTVSLDVRDYDPHAEGMDLDAEYMRTEVTKNDFRIQNHGRNATQRPSIVKDGVVYDVIVTLNESDFSPGPYSWRWQYNGVVVSRGGKSAHGIKAIIECRAKFYPEKKCASLASKVFQSLRVKK